MIGTAADDQVVRLAGSCVLERQKGPILGRAALAHLGGGLAGLGQCDGLNKKYKERGCLRTVRNVHYKLIYG